MEARAPIPAPTLTACGQAVPPPTADPALSAVLVDLAGITAGSRSIAELVDALGDRSIGAVMLVLALPATLMPPGVAAILGAPLLVISAQLVLRRQSIWLPAWLGRLRLKHHRLAPALSGAARMVARLEAALRPRLAGLQSGWHDRLIALSCMGLSLVLILPAPIAHTAAGLGIGAFAGGLLQRDGLAMLAGWGLSAACAVLMALLIAGAVLGLGVL